MTDRELDAAIAEKVMGWDVAGWGDRRIFRHIIPDAKGNRDNPSATTTGELPHFSTDRNAAALVLERIGNVYAHRLVFMREIKRMVNFSSDGTNFPLMTATPRRLMEAALAAVEDATVKEKA